MTRVGFIGLGTQGAPMARRVVEHGYPLTIWARRPETVEPFGDTAAVVVSSPAEVGEASDIVEICVFADADVEDVLLRADGVLAGMSAGDVVAIHSTVHPHTVTELARRAGERGVAVVDAPVSGSSAAAEAGTLLVMAAGDEAQVDRCRPVFETYANPVVYLGPVGAGQMAKAINNLLLAAHMSLAIDAFGFARDLGLDLAGFAQALASGTGGSAAANIVAQSGFQFEWMRENSAKYFTKDLQLIPDIAEAQGVHEPEALLDVARSALPASLRAES